MTVERKSRRNSVEKLMSALDKSLVLVGIPAEDGRDDGGPNNAVLGYILEHGDPERNIPERPFLKPGVESVRGTIVKELERGASRAMAIVAAPTGSIEQALPEVEKSLNRIGISATNAVKNKITSGPFAPLSPRTLAKRKAKGRTGEEPLLDTAQMRNSVTHVIKVKR